MDNGQTRQEGVDSDVEDEDDVRSKLLQGAEGHLTAGHPQVDTIVLMPREVQSETVSEAPSQGDTPQLQGLMDHRRNDNRPPHPEFSVDLDSDQTGLVASSSLDTEVAPSVIQMNYCSMFSTSKEFTRARVFKAVSQGDTSQLDGLLNYLRDNNQTLTSPEFRAKNGKTALLKALLNLKDYKNDTIEVLLDMAEETGDLENFINASYQDPFYNGQTALHVAIERRSFDYVKLLVEKGADVQAKARGDFFQKNRELGFYFGELPLSLAACTNQPNIVTFLMTNMTNRANAEDTDSQGNTVLHSLVVIADNSPESTEVISKMYDHVLTEYISLKGTNSDHLKLENTVNKNGLTPLKLAAKLGKFGLLKHILHREFTDEKMKTLSRKIKDNWVYGPVHASLYDMSSIEADERSHSLLEIVVFGCDFSDRPAMLQTEPLRSLLQDKWDQFASKVFWMYFLVYLLYVLIFTVVAVYRKKGQPPFSIENNAVDVFRCLGELITFLGAMWFLFSTIRHFIRYPPMIKNLYMDGYSDILFLLQALLLLFSIVLYFCGEGDYVGLLVLSLVFAWYNILHFFRGSRRMGMYSVMMQRMIMVDLFHFLCVYSFMLLGFSSAILALLEQTPHKGKLVNGTLVKRKSGLRPMKCKKLCYSTLSSIVHQMCKFTIGMGDLGFADGIQHPEVFYILLTLYIILTYILLLNMLIALMGGTVDSTSKESENIWNLQRAATVLKIERNIPKFLKDKLYLEGPEIVERNGRKFYRVEEMNWKEWNSALGENRDEDSDDETMKPQLRKKTLRRRQHFLLQRLRHHQ